MTDQLSKLFAERMNERMATFYGTATTATPSDRSFTVADLQRAFDLLKAAPQPMWYSTTKHIKPGKLYVLPAQKLGLGLDIPELHVIHDDDEAAFCEAYPHAKHIRQRVDDDDRASEPPTE